MISSLDIKQPLLLLIATMTVWSASALEPFECALLVNSDSQDSLEIANFYARARRLPAENIVRLELPEKVLKSPYALSVAEFEKTIRKPVLKALAERGIDRTVRAWIYSADFPIRIKTVDGGILSLQGMTLCGSSVPKAEAIRTAAYRSPLYAGPGPQNKNLNESLSFDQSISPERIGETVPSMMLSFTGDRGLTVAESKAMIQRGVLADGSAPDGTVYYVATEDASRSRPREWQFEPMVEILSKSNVKAVMTNQPPRSADGIIGFQTGIKTIDTESLGHFRAGAMAEHLTSWAACFDTPGHTKATEWLQAGATASAGTVTEPYALWPKFPTAFFFYHYRSGCTIMESFFQSVSSPVQLLMLGEPLARPWTRKPSVTIVALDDGVKSGLVTFYARMLAPISPKLKPKLSFYLDGKLISADNPKGRCEIETSEIADGHHGLRAVVETAGKVNVRPTGNFGFMVNNRGRIPEIAGIEDGQKFEFGNSVAAEISANDKPVKVGLRSREFVLAEESGAEAEIRFDPRLLGAGKVPVQAYAVYADGEETRSRPITVELIRPAAAESVRSRPEAEETEPEQGG